MDEFSVITSEPEQYPTRGMFVYMDGDNIAFVHRERKQCTDIILNKEQVSELINWLQSHI